MSVSSREIIKKLEKAGWYEVAHEGSHKQFKHADRPGRVTVAHPVKDMKIKTLRSIEQQSGVKIR
ncbi:MAG: type II toxin-antitoxin system HicA family toxin [Alphaproteobacteria bacterium]